MLCQSDLILLHKWGLDDSQSHTTVCNTCGNKQQSKLGFKRLQWCAIEMQHLLHKPYVNEVTLTEHNLYQKSFQSSQLTLILLRGLRSLQRGTVGLCMSKGCKVMRCWMFEKNSAAQPESNHSRVTQVWLLDGRIILQLLQLVTLQPVDLQRPIVPLWKDPYLLNKHDFNWED